MSQKLKCPFCGSELVEINADLTCLNYPCRAWETYLSVEMWQTIIYGKKAQEALKVAISALELVGNGKSDEQGICRFVDEQNTESVRDICRNALENIKAITKKGE